MSPAGISDVLRSAGLGRSVNGDRPSAAMRFATSARVRTLHASPLEPLEGDSDADGGLSPDCTGDIDVLSNNALKSRGP